MNKFLSLLAAILLISFTGCSGNEDLVFHPERIRETMNKVAEWQINHPRHAPNDWTNGAFYAGLFAAWETTQSPMIYDAMMAMGNDSTQWRPHKRWYHADDIAISQTYIDLYQIEQRQEMIQPTIDTLRILFTNPYPHRGIEVIKWWWCDALFMAPPVLVKLGKTLNDPQYYAYNDRYFRECYDLLYNREEKLFARDLNYVIKGDENDRYEANGERIFWSRGNGWVMGGLVRILKELPADYPERPFYQQLFKEMAERILSLQQDDGLWRASLLDPDSYPGGEVSGSGFFCYALAWGVNNGLLDRAAYTPAIESCWVALNNCVNEEGRVGWVQPIGADPRKNFNEDSWEVYGTGAFLLAGSEVIKMTQPRD
ncbi:MAG: glycoside hydrolase family 88 protein [Proteiniphilum sp.]|jgi:rhamnogalacturonyl hydrolase YesR